MLLTSGQPAPEPAIEEPDDIRQPKLLGGPDQAKDEAHEAETARRHLPCDARPHAAAQRSQRKPDRAR